VALALGVGAADAMLRAGALAPVGDSVPLVLLAVVAGWAVVCAGVSVRLGGDGLAGSLLAAGGCAWLAASLGTPGARWGVLFTVGLLSVTAAPVLIGHALFVMTGPGPGVRAMIAALYGALVVILGIGATLAFDPVATGCSACPRNLLSVADAPAVGRWGIRAAAVVLALAAALLLWRLWRAAGAARRRAAPLGLPGVAYLAVVVAALARSWDRGFLGSDPTDRALFAAQSIALIAVAGGAAWLAVSARRRRSRLTRLVIDLQREGDLQAALADQLGDDGLQLLHASRGDLIDSAGSVRQVPQSCATTTLARDGEPVAILCHRPGLFEDARQTAELERSLRLGLEHERLQAEMRRQLAELQRSRAGIAAAGEVERRLLERDLHDGAQQQLAAFAFALGIARQHAPADRVAAIRQAQDEVQQALTELREIAHGLYPVALAEAGLAAAIESLGDRRAGLRSTDVTGARFEPAVEETAYLAIADLADRWSPAPVGVSATCEGKQLVIELRTAAAPPDEVVHLEDRIGALGGSLTIEAEPTTRVRVVIPCG
jgi:signal transduction histidine kinase